MSYVYALILVAILTFIFILSYKLNGKIKVECDEDNACETCNAVFCKKREE